MHFVNYYFIMKSHLCLIYSFYKTNLIIHSWAPSLPRHWYEEKPAFLLSVTFEKVTAKEKIKKLTYTNQVWYPHRIDDSGSYAINLLLAQEPRCRGKWTNCVSSWLMNMRRIFSGTSFTVIVRRRDGTVHRTVILSNSNSLQNPDPPSNRS